MRNVAEGVAREVDLGEANERVFVNNSSIGLYPAAVSLRDAWMERQSTHKWVAMGRAALSTLREFPVVRVTLRLEEGGVNLTTPMVFVGNNRYDTKLFSLGKRPALDEGELWVYLARDAGRFRFVRLVLRGLAGRLDDSRDFQGIGLRRGGRGSPPALRSLRRLSQQRCPAPPLSHPPARAARDRAPLIMPTIAHISDLHFGKEDPPVAEALLTELQARGPRLVAVSGDLTQRAREREFRAARAFLDRLPGVVLVVPGNHDVPLWDVVSRFTRPLHRYRRHLTPDLAPFFHQEDLAVMGVNTARSWTFKNGRISWEQIEQIRARFAPLPERVFKVLVTHHPFVPSPGDPDPAVVGRGFQALQAAEAAGVDLLLAGHLHLGFSGDVRAHHLSIKRSMLVARRAPPSRCGRAASQHLQLDHVRAAAPGHRGARMGCGCLLDAVRDALAQARHGMGARVALA